MVHTTAHTACRDCAQPPFGGPGENRFTAYDAICRGDACRDAGLPQVYVNASNLTLFVRVTDLVFGGPAPALSLDRSYNLDDTQGGPFGSGWSFNLGETLTPSADGSLMLRRGSGRIDRFASAVPGSTKYFAVSSTTDTLVQNADGTYTLSGTLTNPGSTTTRTFSSDGRLLAILDSGAIRVSLDYDTGGNLTVAHYRGKSVKFAYDSGGHINAITDDAGRSVSLSYTPDGRLAQQVNADGQTVTYQYDASGNLTSIGYGGGAIAIAYNSDPPFTSVASVTTPDAAVRQYDVPRTPTEIRVTDGNGDASLFVSNAAGLLQSSTDPAGNQVSYAYDAAGNRLSATNGAGEVTTFTYDSRNNLTGIKDAAGNKWSADYTATGPAHITDPNGNIWTLQYDAAGNLTGVTNPAAGAVSATRPASGPITAITDPRGGKTGYTYNSDGLLTTFVDALNGKWTYQYDGAARVSARTDPGGATLAATYDARNRITGLTSGTTQSAFDYSSLQRDPLGRLVSYADSFGNQVTYAYDAAGQLTAITMPGGKTVTYQYDHAHRLSKVADWGGNFALYRYDAAGWPVSVSVSGGPVTVYQYDGGRRLKAIVSTGPDGTPVAGYRYALDAAGNRTSVSALEPLATLPTLAANTLSYDAANHPLTRSDGQNYQYDARDNLTSIQGSRTANLTYDAFGRLAGFNADNATSYSYDSTGLRVVRTVNGTDRRFLYDLSGARPRVIMELDSGNSPVAWYVYGLGLLWKVTADGTPYFFHFDGDGNVVAVSNPTAGVVNQYRYDPSGRLAASNETVENAFRARGESGWMDDGNGLVFNQSAYLFPELRLTLPATADPAPPLPSLLPQLPGAGTCFLEGVGSCLAGSGRSGR